MPWFWNHAKEVDKGLDNGGCFRTDLDLSAGRLFTRCGGFERMALEEEMCECVPGWIPL